MSFTSPNPEYASIMRSKFTNKEMLIEGTSVINQKYFQNKIGEFWTDDKYKKLHECLIQYGFNLEDYYNKDLSVISKVFCCSQVELRLRIKVMMKKNFK